MSDLFFDTGAIRLYLIADNRLEEYKNQIANRTSKAFTSMVNMVELYYKTMEKLGTQVADSWYWRVMNSDFTVIKDISESVGISSAKLKLKYKKTLSFVDAISLGLTLKLKCILLTTDGGLKDTKEKGKIIHFDIKD
ncbi:MAG: PIN domain-containing protein [Candidatus Hodarchaeota archaeon]